MKFFGLFRVLRLISAVALVWVALCFLIPLFGGAHLSPITGALIAAAFVVFQLAVSKALLIVINAVFRLICKIAGVKTSPSNDSSPLNLSLPYPVSLLLFFGRRILTGILFVVIAPALAPSFVPALPNSVSALTFGSLLAAAFWLTPVALTLLLLLPLFVVGLPAFLLLIVTSRLPRYKKLQSEGQLSTGEKMFCCHLYKLKCKLP